MPGNPAKLADVTITLDLVMPPGRAIVSVGSLGTVGALHADGWHNYPAIGEPVWTPTPAQLVALAMVLAAFTDPAATKAPA